MRRPAGTGSWAAMISLTFPTAFSVICTMRYLLLIPSLLSHYTDWIASLRLVTVCDDAESAQVAGKWTQFSRDYTPDPVEGPGCVMVQVYCTVAETSTGPCASEAV